MPICGSAVLMRAMTSMPPRPASVLVRTKHTPLTASVLIPVTRAACLFPPVAVTMLPKIVQRRKKSPMRIKATKIQKAQEAPPGVLRPNSPTTGGSG